ncbi:hypothetical protein ACHAPT_001269 [Fusarium lateritium]
MRLSGNISDSEHILRDFLSGVQGERPSDELAALHLSQAGNHMYNFQFDEAHEEIKHAISLSKTHDDILWDQMLCLSRALQGSGEFDAARTVLQLCAATPGLPGSKRCLVASALSDVLCELSVVENGGAHLIQAEGLLVAEIGSFRAHPGPRPHPKGRRRLLLALVEVKILQGSHHEARCLIAELLDTYSKLGNLDIVDRLGHVRALIAFARIAPTAEESISSWLGALSWNKFYNPDEEEVFTCGAVYFVLCSIWLKLGNSVAAQEFFQKGTNVLAKKQRQFLIPGLGTYIFDEACADINRTNAIQTIN